jgi:hypothetical protein
MIKLPAFTGKELAYAHLRVIGSPCAVLQKSTSRYKFAPRATADGVLLGRSSDGRQSACLYRVWMLAQGSCISVVDVQVLKPNHRKKPQEPRLRDSKGPAMPSESIAMARESSASSPFLVPSSTPPAPPVVDRRRSSAGGGQGHSASGAPPTARALNLGFSLLNRALRCLSLEFYFALN